MNELTFLEEFALVNLGMHSPDSHRLSLKDGLMGEVLFSFWYSKKTDNLELRKNAELQLVEIVEGINEKMHLNIADGMLGIAMGICWLKENQFIKGNLDEIFRDVDSHIYRLVNTGVLSSHFEKRMDNALIDLMFYFIYRLKISLKKPSERIVIEHLLSAMFNKVYQNIELDFYEETLPGNFSFKLPRFLIAISAIKDLGINDERIKKCLNELKVRVLSLSPYSVFNRIFLCYALKRCYYSTKDIEWEKHSEFILRSINIEEFWSEGFMNYDIFLNGGISGVYILLHLIERLTGYPLAMKKEDLYQILINNTMSMIRNEPSDNIKYGLDGILGVIVILNKLNDEKCR